MGREVALSLGAPLDVFLVRKLGVPGNEELAMGAIASGGVRVLNPEVVDGLQIPPDVVESVALRENRELARREALYRGGRPSPSVSGRTVVLVDDGLATGSSMMAALRSLRAERAGRLVVAVPVAPPATLKVVASLADEVVCLSAPALFDAVSSFYEDFRQTSDDEVLDALFATEAASSCERARR